MGMTWVLGKVRFRTVGIRVMGTPLEQWEGEFRLQIGYTVLK